MAQNVTTYLKNVGKSFGYAMGDVFTQYNPVITSLAKETKEVTTDLYQNIKSFAFEKPSMDEKSLKGQIKDTVSDLWKNTAEDIRTGNFYNKQRQNAQQEDMMKAFGFDFDMDFGFDEDWGDEEESSSSVSESFTASNNASTAQIISAVDQVGYKISGSINNATIESANYIVESTKQSNRALYSLNQRGFGNVTSALLALNNSVVSFAKIGEPLTAHMQNSSVFFTKTTETLDRIDQTLQQIAKNTAPAKLANGGSYRSASGTLGSVFSDEGISIDSYKEMVKENFKDYKDMADMALDAIKGFKGDGGSYGKNMSPMTMITKWVTGAMIPKVLKESMKSLNESLKYSMSAGLIKIRNSSSSNILVSILQDMFLPQDRYKSKINTANYEKGAVAWDGVARKSIVEVIPKLLSKIYSAVSGHPEMVYDYEKGKFIGTSAVKKEYDDKIDNAAKTAGGDFRKDALEMIAKMQEKSEAEREKLTKEVEAYFLKAFTKGDGFNNINMKNFKAGDFGLTAESLAILQRLIREYEISSDRSKRYRGNKFVTDVALGRDSFGDSMRRLEADGISSFVHLNNWETPEGAKFGLDEYNHSSLFYLQGIYQYTGFLADNIGFIAGRSKKIKNRSKLSKNGKVQEINTRTESGPAEKIKGAASTSSYIDEDDLRSKEMEDNKKKLEEGLNEKVDSAKDKTKSMFRKIFGKAADFLNAPANSLAGLLDTITVSMSKLIWGNDNNPEDGAMGYIISKTKESMNNFNKYIEDTFGVNLKEKFNRMINNLFGEKDENGKRQGGKLGEFRDETIDSLKRVGSSLGRTVKQAWNGKAAYGRKVTKTGIVAVSEGELIVPSELNPFYHGVTNKRNQVKKESEAVRNFFGSYAEGGTVGGVSGFLGRGAKTLGSGIHDFIGAILGQGKDTIEKDKKIIGEKSSEILKEAGINKGAMGAGALIGAGASILTGAVVGPLFGAAIGSAVGLVASSDKVQEALFGKKLVGADGKETREGGLLPKELSNFMTKNVPSMGKGAIFGGVAGLFMGSPILGAIAGSTIGFATSSDKAKNFLFGEIDENKERKGGLISKDLQDKVKKAAPNIGAGMIAGALIGPFGLVGNLAVGAGLGYLTTSEKFHIYIFGDGKDDKGLAGLIKDKVVDNIDEWFHNMGNAMKGFMRNLFDSTKEKMIDFFTKRARAARDNKDSVVGKVLNFGGDMIKGATNTVGNVLGGINASRRAKNLRKGYQVYDKTTGKNMFASERMNARGTGASGTFAEIDAAIASARTPEELEALKKILGDVKDPNRVFRRAQNDAMSSLYNGLSGLDEKTASRIGSKLRSSNGREKALAELDKLNLSTEERQKYINVINSAADQLSSARDSKSLTNKNLETLRKQYGINIKARNRGQVNNALDLIDYELTSSKFSTEELQQKKDEDHKTKLISIIESIDANLAAFVGGKAATQAGNNTAEAVRKKAEGTGNTSLLALSKGEPEDKVFMDTLGGIHKYTTNNQGETVPDIRDKGTKDAMEDMEIHKKSISSIPLIGTAMTGMTGMFSSFKDKLIGTEDKPGLFDNIASFLSGEQGPLGGLFSLIAGTKMGKVTSSVLSKINPTTMLSTGLLFMAFKGVFNDFFSNLGWGKDSKKSTVYEDANTGEVLTKDENGNYIDKNGNITKPDSVIARSGSTADFQDKLIENTARGALTNKRSLLTASLSKTKFGKTVSNITKNIVNAVDADKLVSAAAKNNLVDTIIDGCTQFTKALHKIPMLKSFADKLDDMGLELAEKATKAVVSKTAKDIARLASNAVIFAKIAFVVVDFTTGYQDARSTLGIIDEPTVPQKITSGIFRALKNFIPVIGTLIPDNLLFDILVKYIGPIFGIESEELLKQKEEAQATVDAYNEKNNTNYSIQDYNKTVLKDYTWTENIGNAVKTGWENTKNFFSGGSSGIGDGFVSQLDSKYKDMKLGSSTVGQKGCAPAVAAMVANTYGAKLGMNDAVSRASRYQTVEGTTADYFGNVLGSSGISTNYLSGSNIPQQIISNLKGGQPVILLGKDANNTSKKNSPFGPNGHYVLATGIDKNGNIIINDPESKGPRVYSSSILKNARVGIGTSAGAGTSYDTETAQKIYGFFTSHGYSPAAAVGILANLWGESKLNPAAIQKGSGHAAGIAQWESYKKQSGRWKSMHDYAVSRGYKWTELTPQLEFIDKEIGGLGHYFGKDKTINDVDGKSYRIGATTVDAFKNSTDPLEATKQFEKAFERAGKPRLASRLTAATEFYKLYKNSNYTGNYTAEAPNPNAVESTVSSGLSVEESAQEKPTTMSGILGAITTAFSKLGSIFTGSTSEDSGSTTSIASSASEVSTTGGISSDPNGTKFSGNSPVNILRSIAGKLQYSMSGARNPEAGSADCSSTVEWAIKKAGGPSIGNSTPAMYNNSNLQTVWYDGGKVATSLPPNIKENDVLFFSRPNSAFTKGRQDRVGHVELYSGDGKMIGHGSSPGPKEKNVPLGVGKNGGLIKVARVVESGAGSNIINFPTSYSYNDYAKAAGGSSGLLLRANPGSKVYSNIGANSNIGIRTARKFSGGNTGLTEKTTTMLNDVKTNIASKGASGVISTELVQKLITAIIEVLNSIAANTAPVGKIYEALVAYTSGKTTEPEVVTKPTSKPSSSSNNKSSDVDAQIINLVGTLAEIARG